MTGSNSLKWLDLSGSSDENAGEAEHVLWTGRSRFVSLATAPLFIAGLFFVSVGFLLTTFDLSAFHLQFDPPMRSVEIASTWTVPIPNMNATIPLWWTPIAFGFVGLVFAASQLRYLFARYAITDEAVYVKLMPFADTMRLSLDRLGTVASYHPPLIGRLLSFGRVALTTTGIRSQTHLLSGVKQPEEVHQLLLDFDVDPRTSVDLKPEYLRVIPSDIGPSPRALVQQLDSLQELTNQNTPGLVERLNPLSTTPTPTIEFVIFSGGENHPVEFYFQGDCSLDILEQRLRNAYPDTVDIQRVKTDLKTRLLPVGEFEPEEFIEKLGRGELHCTQSEVDALQRQQRNQSQTAVQTDGGTTTGSDDRLDFPLAPVDWETSGALSSKIDGPRLTKKGTVLARPAASQVVPRGIEWYGDGDRMLPLETFSNRATRDRESAVSDRDRATISHPLAPMIDKLADAPFPSAFAVDFQPEPDWSAEAEERKEAIRRGRDGLKEIVLDEVRQLVAGILEAIVETIDSIFAEPGYEDRDDRNHTRQQQRFGHETDSEYYPNQDDERIDLIDEKTPSRTLIGNATLFSVPPPDTGSMPAVEQDLDALTSVFDPLTGEGNHYRLVGQRLKSKGWRKRTKRKYARNVFAQFLYRTIKKGRDRTIRIRRESTRPDIRLNADELANLVSVPGSDTLSEKGSQATHAESSRKSLSHPSSKQLQRIQNGIAMGLLVSDDGETLPEKARLSRHRLTTHVARFAPIGAGKSIGTTAGALSSHATIPGPVVVFDPKGDGMCQAYLQAHLQRFGSLDDVYYFQVPELLPSLSFFDIRPVLAQGRDRDLAVDDKVNQYHEIGRMLMGREDYESAYVAKDILTFLIKALFDEEHGSDAFAVDDLFAAAREMQEDKKVPPISEQHIEIEESLTAHFANDDHQFRQTMNAVRSRVDKIRQDPYLYQIFNYVPDWDSEQGTYAEARFDFRELLEEDVVVLFDLGELRKEPQRAITLVCLSNLWDSVQKRRREETADYDALTHVIIDEAAPVATTELVANELIPEARSFGVGLELLMHYPREAYHENPDLYEQLLSDVKTKLIGNIGVDDQLLKSLVHDELSVTELRNHVNRLPPGEWVAVFASLFGETPLKPFSLRALPIPDGHPESDNPLPADEEQRFRTKELPALIKRTESRYGVNVDHAPVDDASGTLEWGAQPTVEDDTKAPPGHKNKDQRENLEDEATSSNFVPETLGDERIPDNNTSIDPDVPNDEETNSSGGSTVYGVGLPSHIETDEDRGLYHCRICRSEYTADQRATAVKCCAFDAKDDVFEVAHDVIASQDSGDVHGRIGMLVARAAECGIDVSFADVADLETELKKEDEASEEATTEDSSQDPLSENESLAKGLIPESSSGVNDKTLREHDLSRDDADFLHLVLTAMNDADELPDYSLLESMTTLVDSAGSPDIEKLENIGFIEETRVCRRKYFTVLPAGREFLGETLDAQPGSGDLGEKTPHKVGVELLQRWLGQHDGVDHTETYYVHDNSETVFDVAAFDQDNALVWVGEVEMPSHNPEAIISDYQKLRGVDATAIWAVKNLETAADVVNTLSQAEVVDGEVSGRATQSFEKVRAAVEALDAPGLATIRGFYELDAAIDRDADSKTDDQ